MSEVQKFKEKLILVLSHLTHLTLSTFNSQYVDPTRASLPAKMQLQPIPLGHARLEVYLRPSV